MELLKFITPWQQPESIRGSVPLTWHAAFCSGLAPTHATYVTWWKFEVILQRLKKVHPKWKEKNVVMNE